MGTIIIICWIILGIFMAYKQEQCDPPLYWAQGIIILLLAPLWLIVAIIRQVFIEKWK